MSMFKVGDRVQLAYPDEDDLKCGLRTDAVGTVLKVEGYSISGVQFVRWDGFTGGRGVDLYFRVADGDRDVWAVMENRLKAAPQE